MTSAAAKQPPTKTFHAAMHVTRVEHWCVEANTEEEARALFAAGQGHRCDIGERLHLEVDVIEVE